MMCSLAALPTETRSRDVDGGVLMSCLGRTCTLGAVFVSLAFSLGCGGSPCPAGSVAMDGRCISIDAGVDSGPDAQAEAGSDAGDAASDSAITDGGVVDTGTDDGGADAGDSTDDGGADAGDSGAVDSGAVDSGAVDSGPICDGGLVGCGGACIDTTADQGDRVLKVVDREIEV